MLIILSIRLTIFRSSSKILVTNLNLEVPLYCQHPLLMYIDSRKILCHRDKLQNQDYGGHGWPRHFSFETWDFVVDTLLLDFILKSSSSSSAVSWGWQSSFRILDFRFRISWPSMATIVRISVGGWVKQIRYWSRRRMPSKIRFQD